MHSGQVTNQYPSPGSSGIKSALFNGSVHSVYLFLSEPGQVKCYFPFAALDLSKNQTQCRVIDFACLNHTV